MTLRQLEILQAVAETGNFTRAAEKLYLTQSAVSHAVRDLENQAGTALFDRLSKSVRLTQAGRLLLEEVTPILSSCRNLESHIARLEEEAPIRLVSSITIAAFWLPAILQKFYSLRPAVQVDVEVVSAAAALELLLRGEADIAMIEGTIPQGPFHICSLASYHLKFVCAPGYLPNQAELEIDDFCSRRLLLREKGSAIRDVLDSALYLMGRSIRPAWTSVNSPALIQAAMAGFGIAVLPDILVRDVIHQGSLKEVKVKHLFLENELSVLIHRDKYRTGPLNDLLSCSKSQL